MYARALGIAFCLWLPMLATALGQETSVTFANERSAKLREESKPQDKSVIFALSGETDGKWTKRILFHLFPESDNDVAKGVSDLVKWIRQRDKNVRFGILEKKSERSDCGFSTAAVRQ